jgi:hypothetical protein
LGHFVRYLVNFAIDAPQPTEPLGAFVFTSPDPFSQSGEVLLERDNLANNPRRERDLDCANDTKHDLKPYRHNYAPKICRWGSESFRGRGSLCGGIWFGE